MRLVRQDDDGFRAAAVRNLGVAATTGDVLVLLDADTTPEPDFVERMVALPEALPEALVVGRRRHADLAGTGPGDAVEEVGPALELPEPAWLRTAYADTRDLLDADGSGHRFVISAVLACSRWWYDELGGFDETFDTYGGEDWDLAHRSWTAGGLLAHRPDAVAWHDGPDAGAREIDPAARLAETVGVADRTSAPGTTWRGLARGPADVVVTCAPGLGDTEVLVTVDSLLAGPAARCGPARDAAPGAGGHRPPGRPAGGRRARHRPPAPRRTTRADGGCRGLVRTPRGSRRPRGHPRDRRWLRRAAGPAPAPPGGPVGTSRPRPGRAAAGDAAAAVDGRGHVGRVARRVGRRVTSTEERARLLPASDYRSSPRPRRGRTTPRGLLSRYD